MEDPNENPEDALSVDPEASLNGAQVTAILEIISRIRNGELSRSTGERVISTSFPVSEAEARALIADVEEGVTSGDDEDDEG